MSYREDLKFIVCTEEHKRYDTKVKKTPHRYGSFISLMKDRVNESKMDLDCYVTTELSGYLVPRYLPAIDCDSCDALENATAYLGKRNMAYAIMLSSYKYDMSQNRYWVICDKVGHSGETIEFIKGVPGVDPKFALCCKETGIINLRAYPRFFSPPIFICTNTIKAAPSPDFTKWMTDLEDYWYSEEMSDLVRQMVLIHKAQPHVEAMGYHLPQEWMIDVRKIFARESRPRIQARNCLHGMEVRDED